MSLNKFKAKQIWIQYNNEINKLIGHHNTTFSNELNTVGKYLFGKKFKGVFSSDKIPKLKKNQYAILNLDSSDEEGSHWIAMCNDSKSNTYLYDSFGRSIKKIIPFAYKSGNGPIKGTHKNPEQNKISNNCGQLSISFILMFDKYGPQVAKFI